MSDLETELTSFVERYEQATNRHDFGQLVPLIAEDATYWFTEGSYHGIDAIRAAVERTFATILDEVCTKSRTLSGLPSPTTWPYAGTATPGRVSLTESRHQDTDEAPTS